MKKWRHSYELVRAAYLLAKCAARNIETVTSKLPISTRGCVTLHVLPVAARQEPRAHDELLISNGAPSSSVRRRNVLVALLVRRSYLMIAPLLPRQNVVEQCEAVRAARAAVETTPMLGGC